MRVAPSEVRMEHRLLDEVPELSFECDLAGLAVLAVRSSQVDHAGFSFNIGPAEALRFSCSPSGEVAEAREVLQVIRELRGDVFEFVVLEKSFARFARGVCECAACSSLFSGAVRD
jgi:hypothetical protein